MNRFLLLAVPLAPLVGAFFTGLFSFLGKNNPKAAHALTIGSVFISFVFSLVALFYTASGQVFNETIYTWISFGSFKAEVGFLVDNLASLMMCVVSFVSLLVHIYSVGYMKGDQSETRFFATIGFFTFSMHMLVMANNFLQLFFGWEAVGLASYLLIGFWFEKPSATSASLRAFLVNRISDAFFIVGMGLLFVSAHSLYFDDLIRSREILASLYVPQTNFSLLTASCLCLFIGAMGKSAQLPLHLWLPDSMEGPTPVSALIHAATMVTAGIFMVSRIFPLFELSATALSVMLIVGAITSLLMGFVAMVQNDIKQVIAFSTISQLGYMVMALGASAYFAAIFHLMTHAFFKALLFLVAGVVILAMHHDQDIRHMGALKKVMPLTWITALIASFSLAGIPFFSGFYSKDSILIALNDQSSFAASFATVCAYAGIFITAFYTFRLFFMVFHGKSRLHLATPDPNEIAHSPTLFDEKPYKTPKILSLPLVLLAIPSLFIGFFTAKPILFERFLTNSLFLSPFVLKGEPSALLFGLHGLISLPFLLALVGIFLAYYLTLKNTSLAENLARSCQLLRTIFERQLFFNEVSLALTKLFLFIGKALSYFEVAFAFIEKIASALALKLGNVLWQLGEIRLIDGFFTKGSVFAVSQLSRIIRHFQTGYLYHYALVMIVSLFGLMAFFVGIPFNL